MYTDDRNAQVVLALLKAYGINVVIASPGATNVSLVASMQQDNFFTLISAVDERHAAYLACGYATQTKKPVVLSCTGATASRNYLPGLTEAYYRKLPILAITSSQVSSRASNLSPQVTNRTAPPPDSVLSSYQCPLIHTNDEFADCELIVNRAINDLSRAGGGPVHLNLETSYSDFTTEHLPSVRKIVRHTPHQTGWPILTSGQKVLIWIGSHLMFSSEEICAIENFVHQYDAVVLVDHTSSYNGLGAVHASLLCSQGLSENPKYAPLKPDLIIHLGEVSGDYPTMGYLRCCKVPVWRVSEDGLLKDNTGHLSEVFECDPLTFFNHYATSTTDASASSAYLNTWMDCAKSVRKMIPVLPFGNIAIAQTLAPKIPCRSIMHFGILNSLRSWNFFELDPSIETMSNVGGFGIDGCLSTLIGAALATPERLCFGVFGDLSFFYDLNALGNRHVGKNLRILLVNNGTGAEFNLYCHRASSASGDVNAYMAAGGHFGKKSPTLVKHYTEDLGLEYCAAHDAETLNSAINWFVSPDGNSKLLECFTEATAESNALKIMEHLDSYTPPKTLKREIGRMLPSGAKNLLKKII